MQLHLFRHGAIDGPAALYGASDVQLCSQGWQQMEQATKHLPTPETILCSPLKRCRAFAEHYAAKHNCPVDIVPDLREMDFGDWDGKPYDHHSAQWQQMLRFWDNPAQVCPPNGESLETMYKRVTSAWEHCVSKDAENAWVICHGGVIRLILAHILGLDWSNSHLYSTLNIGYASRTDIRIYATGDNQETTHKARVTTIAAAPPQT